MYYNMPFMISEFPYAQFCAASASGEVILVHGIILNT